MGISMCNLWLGGVLFRLSHKIRVKTTLRWQSWALSMPLVTEAIRKWNEVLNMSILTKMVHLVLVLNETSKKKLWQIDNIEKNITQTVWLSKERKHKRKERKTKTWPQRALTGMLLLTGRLPWHRQNKFLEKNMAPSFHEKNYINENRSWNNNTFQAVFNILRYSHQILYQLSRTMSYMLYTVTFSANLTALFICSIVVKL